jgi:endoglucanase
MGVYKHTPAKLAYAYIEDVLSLFDEFGWGWAFWTLRGTFGIFDNERAGTVTETYRGHQLDRALFELIKQHMM